MHNRFARSTYLRMYYLVIIAMFFWACDATDEKTAEKNAPKELTFSKAEIDSVPGLMVHYWCASAFIEDGVSCVFGDSYVDNNTLFVEFSVTNYSKDTRHVAFSFRNLKLKQDTAIHLACEPNGICSVQKVNIYGDSTTRERVANINCGSKGDCSVQWETIDGEQKQQEMKIDMLVTSLINGDFNSDPKALEKINKMASFGLEHIKLRVSFLNANDIAKGRNRMLGKNSSVTVPALTPEQGKTALEKF